MSAEELDFGELERYANTGSADPWGRPGAHVRHDDDGVISVIFGGGLTAADVVAGFAQVPGDYILDDVLATFYCGADDCEGADVPDEEHTWAVVAVDFRPEVTS